MWPVRETQSTHSIQHAARCLFQCDPVASEVAPDTPATPPADPKYLQHLYSYLVSSHPLTTLAWLWLTLYPSSSPHYPLEIESFYPIKRQAHFHLSYSHELRSEMIYSSHVQISYIEYQKTVQSSSVAVWYFVYITDKYYIYAKL